MSNEDKTFMKRFGAILLVLVVITIGIIIIANTNEPASHPEDNPSRLTLAQERIQPVGAVRTEVTAEDTAEAAPATSAPVDPASIDGSAVYAQTCQACHATGAAGAPIPGSDVWTVRASKGLDTLAASAINGINAMPPKGGRTDLSDAEVTAAVEHMLAQ